MRMRIQNSIMSPKMTGSQFSLMQEVNGNTHTLTHAKTSELDS